MILELVDFYGLGVHRVRRGQKTTRMVTENIWKCKAFHVVDFSNLQTTPPSSGARIVKIKWMQTFGANRCLLNQRKAYG